jgi:hypothetical protein
VHQATYVCQTRMRVIRIHKDILNRCNVFDLLRLGKLSHQVILRIRQRAVRVIRDKQVNLYFLVFKYTQKLKISIADSYD